MNKQVALGALFGAIVGLVAQLVFPNFLTFEYLYNLAFASATNTPVYSLKFSIFEIGLLIPIIFGIVGGVISKFISKNEKHI